MSGPGSKPPHGVRHVDKSGGKSVEVDRGGGIGPVDVSNVKNRIVW